MSVENQTGGAATYGKRTLDETESTPAKASKKGNDQEDKVDRFDEYVSNPLFQANIDKMGRPKHCLEQLREAKPDEDLGVEAVLALALGMDDVIDNMKIDQKNYDSFSNRKQGTF